MIAIPSADAETVRTLTDIAYRAGMRTLVLPSPRALVGRQVSVANVHVGIVDCREKKVVLVMGAVGSIDSKLCRQVGRFGHAGLVSINHEESARNTVVRELHSFAFVVVVMLASEVCQCIFLAPALVASDDVTSLDIGDGLKVVAVDRTLIRMRRQPDADMIYTDIRPGEALHAADAQASSGNVRISITSSVPDTIDSGMLKQVQTMSSLRLLTPTSGQSVIHRETGHDGQSGQGRPMHKLGDRRGLWSLHLLVCTMPFMFYVPFGGQSNMAVSDMFLPLIIMGTLTALKGHARCGALGWAWAISTCVVLSAFQATLFRDYVNTSLLDLALFKFVVGCTYLWAATCLLQRAWQVDDFSWVNSWLTTSTLIATGTIASAITNLPLSGIYGSQGSGRYTGSFQDPNLYAVYLGVSACLFVTDRRWNTVTRWAGVSVTLLAIALTSSRGGIVAVLIPGSFIMFIWARHSTPILRLCALALGATIVVLINSHSTFVTPSLQRLEDAGDQPGARSEIWSEVLAAWKDWPIFGIGPGQVPTVTKGVASELGHVAHNTYLGVLAELGVAGFCVIILPILLLVAGLTLYGTGRERQFALMAVPLLIGMLSLSLENARFTWFVLAVIWVAWTNRHRALRGNGCPRGVSGITDDWGRSMTTLVVKKQASQR